jgi:hypothetical protein
LSNGPVIRRERGGIHDQPPVNGDHFANIKREDKLVAGPEFRRAEHAAVCQAEQYRGLLTGGKNVRRKVVEGNNRRNRLTRLRLSCDAGQNCTEQRKNTNVGEPRHFPPFFEI